MVFGKNPPLFPAFFKALPGAPRCFQKIHTFLSVKRERNMLYYYQMKRKGWTFGMMRKTGFSKVSWLGLLAGLLGYFFNATMRSGGSAIPLIAFSVLMALVFWLSAATLEKRARYDEVFHVMRLDFALTVLACIALGAGCVLGFSDGGILVQLTCVVGLVGAACGIIAAVFRLRGTAPSAVFYVPAIFFFVLRLFRDFRRWMQDPAILDYCFCLFALICFMISTYHAASFSFDHGARRRLCFYSMAGTFFGLTAMAGQAPAGMLIYGAGAAFCLVYAMQALGKGK